MFIPPAPFMPEFGSGRQIHYTSNIDLSGERPMPKGVNNLSLLPIEGIHGPDTHVGFEGPSTLTFGANAYTINKKHTVSKELQKSFI
jgi:hypothetical protein